MLRRGLEDENGALAGLHVFHKLIERSADGLREVRRLVALVRELDVIVQPSARLATRVVYGYDLSILGG